jgi:hypothetical protein
MLRGNCFWIVLCASLTGPLVFAQTAKPASTERVLIGILDDAREEMVNWKPGVAGDRIIRPAFEKTKTGWHKVEPSSIPAQINWTVAFDGRSLGLIASKAIPNGSKPKEGSSRYLTAVQAIVTPATSTPSVGAPSEKYSPLATGPTKGRRPLVVVSKPYTSDPDGWKRLSQPPEAIASLLREAFRKDFPHANRCKEEKIVQHNWKFPDSALNFPTTYASNKDTFLVESNLSAGDCGYVDDPNDADSSPWFFVTADGHARRIGSFMSLLDAGDYGNEGGSEVIFILEQPEDTEGFVLFDADMRKAASLLWVYH